MATVTKSGRGGKRSRKTHAAKRSGKKLKDVVAARLKERFAAVAKSSGTDRLGRPEACGSPVRVPSRVTKMLWVEMDNLDKVEALLRCLKFAMEHTDLTEAGGPWFQDVVEVAANLAWRSNMDLQDLWDGRLVEPLLAQGRPAGA
jgi:hypothetical protein